jgi:hypothetical protein
LKKIAGLEKKLEEALVILGGVYHALNPSLGASSLDLPASQSLEMYCVLKGQVSRLKPSVSSSIDDIARLPSNLSFAELHECIYLRSSWFDL